MKTILLIFLLSASLYGQWSSDPTINLPVAIAPEDQEEIFCVSDESGGIILTWVDWRNSGFNDRDIYAQKIDKYGNVKWGVSGTAVCNASGNQVGVVCISDGEGGGIFFWSDSRIQNALDIYAQRIDSMGNAKWITDGVPICTVDGVQKELCITADGNNAILAWQDYRSGEYDIYAQKVSNQGTTYWNPDGLPICTVAGRQIDATIISDGSGGAIIVWDDERSGDLDIYAQKIDFNGSPMWTADGVAVCNASNEQFYNQTTSDGNGGAIITWSDYRNDPDYTDVFAQRINSGGNLEWAPDGIPVSVEIWDQYLPKIASDNSGGAIIVWEEWRSDTAIECYGQRINATGNPMWALNGIPITYQPEEIDNQTLISDGENGAIVTWQDGVYGSENIYVQKINGSGELQWGNDVAISSAINRQEFPFITTDGNDGAIICWEDSRNGGGDDIYAQQVSKNGNLGEVITDIKSFGTNPDNFVLHQNYPNPFNPVTNIRFSLPERSFVKLEIFNTLGERVDVLVFEELNAGNYNYDWNASYFTSGIYFYRLQTDSFIESKKMILMK